MTDGVRTHQRETRTASQRSDDSGLGDAAAFVESFAAAWRAGALGFADFESLMQPDILLTQPLLPAAHGHEGFRAQFDALFTAIPDLRGDVLAWGETSDGVLIDLELHGTLGGRPVEAVTCDRIVLRDGLMAERHARMDPLPLVRAGVTSPRIALGLLRAPSRRQRTGVDGTAPAGATQRVDTPLAGLAVGRLVLGTMSRLAPRATARAFGAGRAGSPELDYMTRIFGARAVALGSGYLLSRGDARRVWQRLALGVDVSDTLAGIGQLRRKEDLPRAGALATVALTGTYAAIGAAKLVRDLSGRD